MRRTSVKASAKAAAALAAVGLLAAGCGGNDGASGSANNEPAGESSAPAASGTITVWADDTRTPIVDEIGKEFTAEKGVTVKVVQKDFAVLKDEFTTQAPEGKGPDILIGAHDWIGALVESGGIAPVELGDKAGEFQDVAVEAFTYDGQTYGLPYAVENIALVRNTDLAPEAPKSWDDLVATGKQLVAQKKAKLPVAIQQDPTNGDPYHLFPLQQSFGSSIFATSPEGGYDASQLTIGDENGTKFAQWLSQAAKDKVINPSVSYDIATGEFAKGRVPYIITGPWALPAFDEGGVSYSVEEIPSPGGEPAVPFVGVQGFMVSAHSENALVANDFVVNYLGTEDAQQELFEVGGRPSAMTTVFEASKDDPVYQGFGSVGAAGVPQPNIPAMDAVWAEWGKTEMAIIKGGDPVKLWEGMTKKIQSTIDSGS
ncbi:MAG TPA: maltose ABC transporter substrate-binding protein [Nocardioidaceae bacterium]|nr:maltose ABC transporter substrate-binding protein [Nocardioidaceae bacterium]